ncbi:restriction endonuclease subunit S [Acinetobacter sp. YH12252]|uniref:restriction endonuclease subunit S n=1 Tax=Acinetobacter sp. YH12252 TaxID=2601177 RepID=UPI0015D4354E|nr:restriction endonuclease subunit S [Acinetobacter sp. YH12252]
MDINLPNTWLKVKLGDICDITYGKGLPTSKLLPEGYPVFGANAVIGYYSEYLYELEKLLISCRGANSGTINMSPPKAFITNNSLVLNFPAFEESLSKLLFFFLQACNKEKLVTGTAQPQVTINNAVELNIHLPPLNEQKRIVQKIEELFSEIDDGIQSLETAKKQLDIYREAILIQAFEGKLTEEWRRNHQNLISTGGILQSKFSDERKLRYENEIEKWKASVKEWELRQLEGRKPTKPRVPKDVQTLTNDTLATLPTLPSEWYWDTLGNITSGVEYGTSAKSKESGSVPVIRMGNIQQGAIDWDDLVYTSDEQEIEQYELKAGDVLFNRTNSPELVGKTAIYKGEQPAIFAGYLIRVNHYSNLIDSNFLNYYLNSHIAKTYGNSVKTDGVNQSNINGEKLQNYPFPFCSLEEQKEIVKIISNFLDKEKVTRQYLDSELKRAHLLKQSILQKAFSGQLVPQNPNDEPASVLLERIMAEKEEELAKAKANKAPKKPTKRKTKATKEDEPAQQELI